MATPVLKMNATSCYFPKEKFNHSKEGEDAHFVSNDKNSIGVADGIGGWAKKGVDAGIYARGLMNNSLVALEEETKGCVDPARVLEKAYENTKNVKGSSTACIIALNEESLEYANVRDSGLMVFRNKQMIYRSPIQQREFNHPYQLGGLESKSRDTPGSAHRESMIVKGGDIVVAGTDGLFDNIYPWEIMVILEQICDKEPLDLAMTIAENALYNALDTNYFSPFEETERCGLNLKGGKYDDITVIVAKIENNA